MSRQAFTDAVQVADRWHLMENSSDAFLMAVKRRMRSIQAAFGQALFCTCQERCKCIEADYAAVTAAITSPESNGQTEGTICQLKSMKRQMYGSANIDLLRARSMPIAA